jgi:hypothetical protein
LEADEDNYLQESLNDKFIVKLNTLKEFDEVTELDYLKKVFRKN